MLGGRVELVDVFACQPVLAPAVTADQRAVHDQVGVATDGRGEVGVGLQRQAEVPEIFGVVVGLGYGTESGDIDQLRLIRVLGLGEKPIEVRGFQNLTFGEGEATGVGDFS